MAESKGALIAKTMQKHAGRAKEKFLQNLGKVDRTADDIFDEHLQNFTRQQNSANRLQKEFNNYIRCVRAVQAASKTLMDSLNEIYESQWTGHDLLYVQAQNLDMLWQDFTHKLADQVLVPFNTYQSQFPEMRKKIDKRGRKLVDYDGQRHSFQSLQCNPKKRVELKVTRGKELLEEAKRTYEQLNSELHDELPALYDSRVLFLVTNLQTLFAAEQVFHVESAKVYSELEAIVDKLANESQRGSYAPKKISEPQSPKSPNANSSLIINTQPPPQNNITAALDEPTVETGDSSPTTQLNGNANSNANSNDNSLNNQDASPQNAVPPTKRVEELYDIPVGATTENLPPGVLYRVKATYKYSREDVDELSFDVGEIIRVVEYDDPEEQVEEALAGDRQSALIQHLDLATSTLEALMLHVRSLHVSHLASHRVFDFAHQLVLPYHASSNLHGTLTEELRQAEALKENRLARLKSVMDICAANVTASERLQSVIDENQERREDFAIAARNFKNLLDNTRLSISQMEKLQRQYESILMDYRESRRALDIELPKIVRTRLGAIGQSLRVVGEFYSDFEYGNQTANFFKLISENLCHEESVPDRVTCKGVPPEVCQKCRVNRIDEQ